tara:strand:- start:3399 stop:5075 length:1677 start_codon:yes stop_codon:yes gene_type:complete
MSEGKKPEGKKMTNQQTANYFSQGLLGPIINGASDCLKKNTRCVPRNWNPLAQCTADADNAQDCAGCKDFDDTFQRCLDGDDTYQNVNNTWVPNPAYVQSCFNIGEQPSIILTNGLAEQPPFYREYDPCWFADDPTDVRCTCKILDLATPENKNKNGGMCGGANYVYEIDGKTVMKTPGEGCYADSKGNAIGIDNCTTGDDLEINRLSNQSPWRQEGNSYKDKKKIPRNVACAWIPSSMYNVGDDDKTTIPEGLQPKHICGTEKKFTFRVRGVEKNQGEPVKDKTTGKTIAPPAEDNILCGLQPVCLLNGDTIAHNDGKCYGPDGAAKSCTSDSDCGAEQFCSDGNCSCQVDSDCNINKNEVCRGNPVTNKCGADSDCEKGADFWGNIIPAYGTIRDLGAGDKKYPFTCRKANQYPWRQYLRASKCTYLPSTSDEDAKSGAAGAVAAVKDIADGISLAMLGVPLGSMFFGDPDKDAKEQLQRSKDRYSKITPMQSLQFSKDQQKVDADMIQFSKESSDLVKATEEAAQQQIEFMVKENTLFISILAVLLLMSIVFELI